MTQQHDKILIVDFGSQVTQLIARRLRETGGYCEIPPFQKAEEAFERLAPQGVIFSGGPASVPAAGSPRAPQAVFVRGRDEIVQRIPPRADASASRASRSFSRTVSRFFAHARRCP